VGAKSGRKLHQPNFIHGELTDDNDQWKRGKQSIVASNYV
jgi:tRNA A-37 threonylcarbamoyl transferase component Bud32